MTGIDGVGGEGGDFAAKETFEERLKVSMVGWPPIGLGGSHERPGRWKIFRWAERRTCPQAGQLAAS